MYLICFVLVTLPPAQLYFSSWQQQQYSICERYQTELQLPHLLDVCPVRRTAALPALGKGSLRAARAGSLPTAPRRPTTFLRLQASTHHHHVYRSGGSSANNCQHHVCITWEGWKQRRFGHMRSRVLHHYGSLLWYIPILPHLHHPRLNPGHQGQGDHGIWAKEDGRDQHRTQCGCCCLLCAVPRHFYHCRFSQRNCQRNCQRAQLQKLLRLLLL